MEVLRQEDFKVEVKKVKNENDDEQRIKNNLVFSTIMGYNHHMMEFGKEKELVKEMKKDVSGIFELDEYNMEIIMNTVEEINVKEKKDDDIIEEEKCNADIQSEGGNSTIYDE